MRLTDLWSKGSRRVFEMEGAMERMNKWDRGSGMIDDGIMAGNGISISAYGVGGLFAWINVFSEILSKM